VGKIKRTGKQVEYVGNYTVGGDKGKENDRTSTVLKYITSVQVEDMMICTESCRIMGGGKKGEGRVTERIELTKLMHIHSWAAQRNPFEC
jgi:hypothetical protein